MKTISTPKFALIGSGRVARHLKFYIETLGLPLAHWSRNGDPAFNSGNIMDATHFLLAVRDDAISEAAASMAGPGHTLIHFSGAAQVPGTSSAHPLMTFGTELQSPDWYRRIPFVVSEDRTLAQLLPGFPNPSWSLQADRRALYHALCSLAGNASFLLWNQIGDQFEQQLGLPRKLLSPFLHQVVSNCEKGQRSEWTGPVPRHDWMTVEQHLDSLMRNPELLKAYRDYLGQARAAGVNVPEAFI